MDYIYSEDVGCDNQKMCVRLMHSDVGPKNIAIFVAGGWINVNPITHYQDDTDTWFMTWYFPKPTENIGDNDDYDEDEYEFSLYYDSQKYVWFSQNGLRINVSYDLQRKIARTHLQRLINSTTE